MRFLVLATLAVSSVFNSATTSAQEPANESDRSIQKAKRLLSDYILDMEQIGDFAVLYSGEVVRVLSDQVASGIFPFTGFRAIQFDPDTRTQFQRFWQIKAHANASRICYDELLIDDDRWLTRQGQPPIKFVPKNDREFSDIYMRVDPRTSIVCTAGAMEGGQSANNNVFGFLQRLQLVSAKQEMRKLTATYEVKTGWLHIVYDQAQGDRPVVCAVTHAEEKELKDDASNARILNRMRWRKNKSGIWMPEAGDNAYFFYGRPSDYKKMIHISYQCLWMEPTDLPAGTFDKATLDSREHVRVGEVERLLEKLESIRPLSF